MSKDKTNAELQAQKNSALNAITTYLDSMISSPDQTDRGRADKLCYWLVDYMKYLDFESEFSPKSLRRYHRGEVIKVNLGYNIGSEEGGLHYAVVLDKNNSVNNPVVTIVPLTSIKPGKDLSRLRPGEVNLGDDLFRKLYERVTNVSNEVLEKVTRLEDAAMNGIATNAEEINDARNELHLLRRMQREISRMKVGSIALTMQVTTVSKIRIYDPKTDHDVLSKIRLSNESLDAIDKAICENLTGLSV